MVKRLFAVAGIVATALLGLSAGVGAVAAGQVTAAGHASPDGIRMGESPDGLYMGE
jgi:hypothetical protein